MQCEDGDVKLLQMQEGVGQERIGVFWCAIIRDGAEATTSKRIMAFLASGSELTNRV